MSTDIKAEVDGTTTKAEPETPGVDQQSTLVLAGSRVEDIDSPEQPIPGTYYVFIHNVCIYFFDVNLVNQCYSQLYC